MSREGNKTGRSSVYAQLNDRFSVRDTTAEAAPKGLFSRVFGVFFSPRATYAAVAARPRWFGVLAVSCIIVSGSYFGLLSTEVGKQAAFDQQTQMLESFGVKLNEQALERMEAGIDRAGTRRPSARSL